MAVRIFKQANVVTPEEVRVADVVCEKGKIVEISSSAQTPPTSEVIDCAGKYLLPGVIDVHVHFRTPGFSEAEDFRTGSLAALAGGVTFVCDMPNTRPTTTTTAALLEKKRLAARDAKVHVEFFMGATGVNTAELRVVKGICGVKVPMSGLTGIPPLASKEVLDRLFLDVPHMLVFHAEDPAILQECEKKYKDADDPTIHPLVRPAEAEFEAVRTVLHLAKKYEKAVHICHISSKMALEEIQKFKNARDRRGNPLVTTEVTPHHLFLTQDAYRTQGNFVKTNPPIRTKEDQEALWEALKSGLIDMVATDHAPHLFSEKEKPYWQTPAGVPGVETSLQLLLNEVNHGRLTLQRVAEICAEKPARRFGFQKKGRIAVGYDSDLVLVDMEAEWEIKPENLKTKCGWSPFSGWKGRGLPKQVFYGKV